MARKLKKMVLNRVDLVAAGACQDAHIVLFKTKEPVQKDEASDDAPPLDYAARGQQLAMRQEFLEKWRRFCEVMWELMEDGERDAAVVAPIMLRSIEQFRTDVSATLTALGLVGKAAPMWAMLTEVSKAGAVLSAANKQRLRDAMQAMQAIMDEAEPIPAESATMKGKRMAEAKPAPEMVEIGKLRETEAQVRTLEKDNAALKAELVAKSLTSEEQEAAYLKTLPESVRKRYEADQVEKAELKEALRIEKDKRERQEYIEKTAAYRQVGLTPDHHNVLKAIDAMPEQERTELLRILKSASEVIKAGALFTVAGKDGGVPVGGAGERIVKMAKDKAAASEGKMTYHQAYAQVLDEQPALYQEYRTEMRERA